MIDPENFKKINKDEIIECCSNIADWGFNDYESWEQQSAVYGLLELYKEQQKKIREIEIILKEYEKKEIDYSPEFYQKIRKSLEENNND